MVILRYMLPILSLHRREIIHIKHQLLQCNSHMYNQKACFLPKENSRSLLVWVSTQCQSVPLFTKYPSRRKGSVRGEKRKLMGARPHGALRAWERWYMTLREVGALRVPGHMTWVKDDSVRKIDFRNKCGNGYFSMRSLHILCVQYVDSDWNSVACVYVIRRGQIQDMF